MPWMISEKNGFAISGTVTSNLRVVSVRKLLAAALGEYPSWCTALSTRRRVASETFSGLLSTRDTVAVETSARAATSWMVVISMSVNNVVPGPGPSGTGTHQYMLTARADPETLVRSAECEE